MGCHSPDLHGLFRDTAVMDVLMQTFLPAQFEALSTASIQPLWLTVDYFLTLGTKVAPLAIVVRLWDFCFLHGPRSLFCGLLAQLDLFFQAPLREEDDAETLIDNYRTASRKGDPEEFAMHLFNFLHTREGGISGDLVEGLRFTLGQRDISLDSFPPHVLSRARDLMTRLSASGMRELQSPPPKWSSSPLAEDGAAHETWQTAIEVAGTPVAIDEPVFDHLLAHGHGMPLKYRHALWPLWLRVEERQAQGQALRRSFETCVASAPDTMSAEEEANIRQICEDGELPGRAAELQRVVAALRSYNPGVGSMDSIYLLAVVFLKLGFEEEATFWMLAAALEDLLSPCTAPGPGQRGLFRDTAVVTVLLHSFLPVQSAAISSAGIDVFRLTGDYFGSLGARNMPLPAVVRLWDLCFLHGPQVLFSGIMALLELCLPAGAEGALEATELISAFHAAAAEIDPELFATQVVNLLHVKMGGISRELVAGLRTEFGVQ